MQLRFCVADTGIGIPASKHQAIFEAFSQADASATRRFGGTGLGLAISSAMVKMMGGSMGMTSEPGKGSAFFFELPAKLAPRAGQIQPGTTVKASFELPMSVPPPVAPKLDETAQETPGLKVLLAEDNPVNQLVTRKLLEKTWTPPGIGTEWSGGARTLSN